MISLLQRFGFKRLLAIGSATAIAFCSFTSTPSVHASASFPERPIRIVVPFPPGGVVDLVARMFAEKLGDSFGQPVIVDNRGGAGGAIGADHVAKSAADGYSLLMATASTHGTNSATQKRLPYDPVHDFTPITQLATTPYALVANPKVEANNVREMVQWAKANPGVLNFATFGSGSSNHLAAELFKGLSGVDIVHVPYRGAAPAMADLLAGQVHIMFDTFPSSIPHLKQGSIKLLGVGSAKPFPLYPDAPTLEESGVKGYVAGTWFGVFAPAGTPPDIVEKLRGEFVRILAMPDIHERLVTTGLIPVGSTSAELGAIVASEIASWQALVRDRELKFD